MSRITDDTAITSEAVLIRVLLSAAADVVDALTSSGVCEVCDGTAAAHVEGCALARLDTAIREATDG